MSVKHAVLGLLIQRKQSYPYELTLLFKERVGPAWDINGGQIYQMVMNLEKEGLIERVESKTPVKKTEWEFHATMRGKEEFDRWYASRTGKIKPHRDDLVLKLALSTPDHIDDLLSAVDRQERICVERLEEYMEIEKEMAGVTGTAQWREGWSPIILKAAISHLNVDLKWMRELRDILHELAK